MPRNASGVYSLPPAAGNPVVSATAIEPDWANQTLNDIATALTASLPRDGSAPMTAALLLAGNAAVALAAVPKQQLDAAIAAIPVPAATGIANIPSGNIAAVTVQEALNELDTEKQPIDATLTALAGALSAADKIPYATALNTLGELTRSVDEALAGNSDTNIPTEKAVKTYVDTRVATSVADSEFTGANQLIAASGYQKLPGGLVIQWGAFTTSAAGYSNITFPLAFPTALLAITGNAQNQSTPVGYIVNFGALGGTTTVPVDVTNATGGYVATTINWIAIGY